MKTAQKIVLLVGIVVLIGMAVFPPYVGETFRGQTVTYAPIFSPPQGMEGWTLDLTRLGIQALIGIVTLGGLVLLFGSGDKTDSN